jgi:hypothetical protein
MKAINVIRQNDGAKSNQIKLTLQQKLKESTNEVNRIVNMLHDKRDSGTLFMLRETLENIEQL